MKQRHLKIFLAVVGIQLLVFTSATWFLNNHADRLYFEEYDARIPNLRKLDWLYFDVQAEDYVDAFIDKYGVENLIAFVGDSVVYTHGTRASATAAAFLDRQIRRLTNGKRRVINLGADGSGEGYFNAILSMLREKGLKDVFFPLNVRDSYFIRTPKALMDDEQAKKRINRFESPEQTFLDRGVGKRGIPLSELEARRSVVKHIDWVSVAPLIVQYEWPESASRVKIPRRTERKKATKPDQDRAKKRDARFRKWSEMANKELGKGRIKMNSHWVGQVMKKFSDQVDGYRVVISPMNTELEIGQRNLDPEVWEYFRDLLVVHARSNGFPIYDGMADLPTEYFRYLDVVHLNFFGAIVYGSYLAAVDPMLSSLLPKMIPVGFEGEFEWGGQFFRKVTESTSRIVYQEGPQRFEMSAGPGKRAYWQLVGVKDICFAGRTLGSGGKSEAALQIMDVTSGDIVAEMGVGKGQEFEVNVRGGTGFIRVDGDTKQFGITDQGITLRFGIIKLRSKRFRMLVEIDDSFIREERLVDSANKLVDQLEPGS